MMQVMANDTMGICSARYGEEDFDFDFNLRAPPEDEDEDPGDTNCLYFNETSHKNESADGNYLIMDNEADENAKDMNYLESTKNSEENEQYHNYEMITTGNNFNTDPIPTSLGLINNNTYSDCTGHSQRENASDMSESGMMKEKLWESDVKRAESMNSDFIPKSPLSPQKSVDSRKSSSLLPSEVLNMSKTDSFILNGDNSENYNLRDDYNRVHSALLSSPNSPPDDFSSSRSVKQISELDNVIVLYQSNEYALFSDSEFDDPNSFFTKDHTIAQKSLNKLFQAIRDVVHEDLDEESELVISFPNFSLQIEEKSTLTHDLTLSKIICLRRQLMLNDGIDCPQPIYIDLGVRKNFVKELMRISRCANDGKGLSEIVSWNENPEDTKELTIFEGNSISFPDKRFLREKSIDEREPTEILSIYKEESIYEVDAFEEGQKVALSKHRSGSELDQGQQVINDSGLICTSDSSPSDNSHSIESPESFRNKNSTSTEAKSVDCELIPNCFYDLDNDVIGYSEDEIEEEDISTVQITVPAEEYTSDSNWNLNKNSIKSFISIDEAKTYLTESSEYDQNFEYPSFTQTSPTQSVQQDIKNTLNNLDSKNEKNAQNLDNEQNLQYDEGQSIGGGRPNNNQMTNVKEHVDNPDDTNKVKFLEDNDKDSNPTSKQSYEEESRPIDPKENSYEESNEFEAELSDQNDEGFPTIDNVDNLNSSGQDVKYEAESVVTVELTEFVRNPDGDGCSRKSLIGSSQASTIISLSDQSECEVYDEIDYEEEDEENNVKFEEVSPESHVFQPDLKNENSINGKRSRADCRLEVAIEKRDAKRSCP